MFLCESCGLQFQEPMPDRALAATFYGQGYWRETENGGFFARLQRIYVDGMLWLDLMGWIRRLRLAKGSRVLDVGCSRGDWLARMALAGYEVKGVEGDARAAEYAKAHYALDIDVCDVEDWQPATGQRDLITAFHVTEHLSDPRAFLRKCHQSLRQDGRLLLRVPNVASWQALWFGSKWKGLEPPRHLYQFTPRALTLLLEQTGFTVVKSSTWSWRDGPPALASSCFPAGEATYQTVRGDKSVIKQLIYLALTTCATPIERWAAILHRGGMLTVVAQKHALDGNH